MFLIHLFNQAGAFDIPQKDSLVIFNRNDSLVYLNIEGKNDERLTVHYYFSQLDNGKFDMSRSITWKFGLISKGKGTGNFLEIKRHNDRFDDYIREINFYLHGKQEAKAYKFYDNGKLQEVSNYQNNLKSGVFRQFKRNGKKWVEIDYKKGLKNGKFKKYFHWRGKLTDEIDFVNGLKNGCKISYYRGIFRKFTLCSIYHLDTSKNNISYRRNGSVKYIAYFKKGKYDYTEYYNRENILIKKTDRCSSERHYKDCGLSKPNPPLKITGKDRKSVPERFKLYNILKKE